MGDGTSVPIQPTQVVGVCANRIYVTFTPFMSYLCADTNPYLCAETFSASEKQKLPPANRRHSLCRAFAYMFISSMRRTTRAYQTSVPVDNSCSLFTVLCSLFLLAPQSTSCYIIPITEQRSLIIAWKVSF